MPQQPHQTNDDMPAMGMSEATGMMHEMYLTLQRSGFTADEALKLVSNMLGTIVSEALQQKTSGH